MFAFVRVAQRKFLRLSLQCLVYLVAYTGIVMVGYALCNTEPLLSVLCIVCYTVITMIKVCVGSKNNTKVQAIQEGLQLYDEYKDAEVVGVSVESGVSDQPLSLDETIQGSHNRAKNSFSECVLSVGIESGLMQVPQVGYMDVSVVSVYDGDRLYTGFSPAIALPKRLVDTALEGNIDLSRACKVSGLTSEENIGHADGFVGLFTGGRMTRKEYTKYGLIMAMAYKEHHLS